MQHIPQYKETCSCEGWCLLLQAQAHSVQSSQGASPDYFITPSPTGLGAGLPPPIQRAPRGGQTLPRGRHNPASSPQTNG